MNEPIVITQRAAAQVQSITQKMRDLDAHLTTYVEALGAALDVPPGYRFDVQAMAFMPPPEQTQAEVAGAQEA